MDEICSKSDSGDHNIKFNGGNPVCIRCNQYRDDDYVPREFYATVKDGKIILGRPKR